MIFLAADEKFVCPNTGFIVSPFQPTEEASRQRPPKVPFVFQKEIRLSVVYFQQSFSASPEENLAK